MEGLKDMGVGLVAVILGAWALYSAGYTLVWVNQVYEHTGTGYTAFWHYFSMAPVLIVISAVIGMIIGGIGYNIRKA